MALRTADEYRQGLRDGRTVYIMGNPVSDVTEDPYIKVGVETAAHDFLLAHDPEKREIAVMKDPETGEDISAYFEVPDHPESVRKRHNLILEACYYADGAIPFVKDVGTDIINALSVASRLTGNKEYEKRVNDYRRYCAGKDLSLAGAVTDVKGDRKKGPSGQESPDYYLRIVDKTADEIVVSGAKAHITAGTYVDEILVIPTRNLTEKEADYAVAFAVPVDTPGITQICRPNFRFEDRNHFPTPKPKRGHIESLLIFDEVRIPKERVFMQREWQFAQALAYAFAAFHRFTAVTYKIPILEFMTGLGILAAEANGINRSSHIREAFIEMIKYTETTRSLAKAAMYEPEDFGGSGLFVPNRLTCNMAKLFFASHFHEFIRLIQDITGGILVTQPTYRDWENPDLRPYLERYLGGAEGYDAETRMKLMSMLHHVVGSDFAAWHEVCTVHAEGSFASQKMMLMVEAPMKKYKEAARKLVGLHSA
ncbi:MAG: gamma-aminobutyrate dehydratase [Deltaproteobacteria bacterium]|nr:gamma-aminobutyrate dehydratase [Deltaproteobacteria bacterium]